jgi:2-polyprenyl-3-methyl-5-hydroxy-6-metoxy-1,4-benzoquinol methylase/uncharacterized protein YbaR (Trm112 family)
MNPRLLQLLVCPSCRSEALELFPFTGPHDAVLDGIVHCRACGAQYPLEGGVLELLPPALQYQEDRRIFFGRWKDVIRGLGLPDPANTAHEPASAGARQAMAQQTHFDWYAGNDTQSYSDYAASPFWRAIDDVVFAPWKREVLRAAAERPTAVLDVGCAQGRSTFHLARLGAQLVAFDVSKHCIRVAQARAREGNTNEHMTFICADSASFPFRTGVFDFVLVYGVLHHVSDPAHACTEIARVLKPGGTYIGSENNRTAFRALFDLLQRLRPAWHELAGPEALISKSRLDEWMQAAGLRLEARTHVFLPPHAVNLLPDRIARQVLGMTDSFLGALPFFRSNGGLITFTARKPS